MESEDARLLPVTRDGDELVIDVSEDAIDGINDAVHKRDERAEITYVIALRRVIRHAQATWFDEERAVDEEPVESATIDEEAVEEELNELEEELEGEKRNTIDKEALGEELEELEESLPEDLIEDRTDDEIRELVDGIRKEKEAFEKAMEIDTSELLQDDGDGEEE